MHKFIPKKLLCIPSSWKPCKVLYTNKLLLSLIYFDSTFFIGWKLICFLLQFSLLFLKSWSWRKLQSKISFIAKKKKHLNWSVSVHLIGKSHWLQKHFVFTWNNDKHIYLHYCEKKIFEVKYRENISLYKHE